MERENRDIQYFEKLEYKFDEYMDNYDVSRRLYLIFSVLLDGIQLSGKKVLEIGCGTGRFSEPIVDSGGQLTVVDIGETLVKTVSKKLCCEGLVADACNLPIEDESYDVIISSECIEHTLNPIRAVREMCRVCRKGGYVCLTTPNKLWYPVLWVSEKLHIRKFLGIENWIFPSQAKTAMQEGGMEKIRIHGCHLWPFQLTCTRSLLSRMDSYGGLLYPVMINFGIIGLKGRSI